MLQAQQCQIQAKSSTYTTDHGNAGSPAGWARSGIEPTSSVGFTSTAPQWELLFIYLFIIFWPCLWHVEVPRPEIKPMPQQWPEPVQWQCWNLKSLSCKRTSYSCPIYLFISCTRDMWKFLGEGLNPSHSCKLCHSCGNNGSFNPLCRAGDWTCVSAATWASAVGFLTYCTTVGTPPPLPFTFQTPVAW